MLDVVLLRAWELAGVVMRLLWWLWFHPPTVLLSLASASSLPSHTASMSKCKTAGSRDGPPDNLILLADGSGNDADTMTNISHLHHLLRNDRPPHATNDEDFERSLDQGTGQQFVFYVPGLSSFKGHTDKDVILGRGSFAFAVGLYKLAARHYRPGDRIMFLAFSRGAFFSACVAALINAYGLLDYPALRAELQGAGKSDAEVEAGFEAACCEVWRMYEAGVSSASAQRYFWSRYKVATREVFLLGNLETVKGMVEGVSPRADGVLGPGTIKVFHALAKDDCRQALEPIVLRRSWAALRFDPSEEVDHFAAEQGCDRQAVRAERQRVLEQVWFAGCHPDVGGGSMPDCVVAQNSLLWLLAKITPFVHLLDGSQAALARANLSVLPTAALHDREFHSHYPFGLRPRRAFVHSLSGDESLGDVRVHFSLLERIRLLADAYKSPLDAEKAMARPHARSAGSDRLAACVQDLLAAMDDGEDAATVKLLRTALGAEHASPTAADAVITRLLEAHTDRGVCHRRAECANRIAATVIDRPVCYFGTHGDFVCRDRTLGFAECAH